MGKSWKRCNRLGDDFLGILPGAWNRSRRIAPGYVHLQWRTRRSYLAPARGHFAEDDRCSQCPSGALRSRTTLTALSTPAISYSSTPLERVTVDSLLRTPNQSIGESKRMVGPSR